MDGVLNILKPPGMTSHDVVAYLRRVLKVKRIGHTGTLDPGVPGVLPVCVGRATRIAEYLTEGHKHYRAEVTFGITTNTEDADGEVTAVTPVVGVTAETVTQALEQFKGQILQTPPMVSAVKYHGQKLYKLAREGIEIERQPRQVEIFQLSLVRFWPETPQPRATIDIVCSKGTYVRTLCADLGKIMGCGAYMSFLVRLASGGFKINDAVGLTEVADAALAGQINEMMFPLAQCLSHLPQFTVESYAVRFVENGVTVRVDQGTMTRGELAEGTILCLNAPDGQLLAIGRAEMNPYGLLWLKPVKVFN